MGPSEASCAAAEAERRRRFEIRINQDFINLFTGFPFQEFGKRIEILGSTRTTSDRVFIFLYFDKFIQIHAKPQNELRVKTLRPTWLPTRGHLLNASGKVGLWWLLAQGLRENHPISQAPEETRFHGAHSML